MKDADFFLTLLPGGRLARNLDDLRRLVHKLTGRGVRIEWEFGISRETLYQYLRADVERQEVSDE